MTSTTQEPVAIAWGDLTDAELAASYMTCRTRKEQAKEAMDRAAGLMDDIKAAMLARMNERGSTGFKVEGVATVTRVPSMAVKCDDWEQFLSFVLHEAIGNAKLGRNPLEAFAFLHRRVSIGAVQDWMDAHNSLPPVGISAKPEYEVSVRKA